MMDLKDVYRPTPFTGEITVDLMELEWFLTRPGRVVDMHPPYQRDSAWTLEQREAFMGHLLTGGEVMPIIVQRVPDGGPQEVLDGKQRLETMLGWLHGQWSALLPDGRRLCVFDLPTRMLGDEKVPAGLHMVSIRVKYVNMPFEERKRFYVRFNSAGTPHTKADLERALAAKERS
jgi:hypothetical protein